MLFSGDLEVKPKEGNKDDDDDEDDSKDEEDKGENRDPENRSGTEDTVETETGSE